MVTPPIDPRCFQSSDRGDWNNLGLTHVYTSISLLGLIGTILTLVTIHYGKLKESPYVYLTCIAVADLIYMVFGLSVIVTGCETCGFSLETVFYFVSFFRYCYMVVVPHMNAWLALLTLFMTVERFIYVRWPLKTRSLCTRERAKKICFALFLVSGTFEVFQPFRNKIQIVDQYFAKPGTSIGSHGFQCAWNADETESWNRYTCQSKEFPLDLQSNASDGRCSDSSTLPKFILPRVPRTNRSFYSLDCLHQYCKLPTVPVDLGFNLKPSGLETQQDSGILETVHKNMSIVVVINGTSDEHPELPHGDLVGRALRLNDSCVFIMSTKELGPMRAKIINRSLEDHIDTVQCVKTVFQRSRGWKEFFLNYSLKFWHFIYVLTTGILTIFNILIGIEVRRANRDTKIKGLSKTEDDAKSQRRIDENRLTMSLLALSCVKIVADVLFITTWPRVAKLLYKELHPPGVPLRVHHIISNLFHLIEKSSYFYLLAFINRKFKRVFVQKVLYEKLRVQKLSDIARSIFSNASETSTSHCQESSNQKERV